MYSSRRPSCYIPRRPQLPKSSGKKPEFLEDKATTEKPPEYYFEEALSFSHYDSRVKNYDFRAFFKLSFTSCCVMSGILSLGCRMVGDGSTEVWPAPRFVISLQGCIHVYQYPEMELEHVLQAHSGNCICIEFDKTGKYFAVGSADALVSLWDVQSLACVRTFARLVSVNFNRQTFTYRKTMLVSA